MGTWGCSWPPHPALAVEDLSAKLKPYQQKDWRHAPRFLTPLKQHTVLRGQDCTMTCAFLGNPRPTVTLYKGDVNITANSKFWYNSTSGVCTIFIPTCTLKDSGEYSVLVENELGKDRSSCTLTVYGEVPWRLGVGMGWEREVACVPSGAEAQNGGRVGLLTLCMTGKLLFNPPSGVNVGHGRCHSPPSMSFVMCLAPADVEVCKPLANCSLQPLVGLDLALKVILVIRPNPDSSITIFWQGPVKNLYVY